MKISIITGHSHYITATLIELNNIFLFIFHSGIITLEMIRILENVKKVKTHTFIFL